MMTDLGKVEKRRLTSKIEYLVNREKRLRAGKDYYYRTKDQRSAKAKERYQMKKRLRFGASPMTRTHEQREAKRVYMHEYYLAHQEKMKADCMMRYLLHRDEHLVQNRIYHKKHSIQSTVRHRVRTARLKALKEKA